MADINRPVNEAVHNYFQGTVGSTGLLDYMGYDQKDLNDAGLLQRIFLDKSAWDTRNRHGISALMVYAAKKNSGVKGTVATWNAADEERSVLSELTADFNTASSTTVSFGADDNELAIGAHVALTAYDDGTGTSEAGFYHTLIKITSEPTVTTTSVYDCTIISRDLAGSETNYVYDITGGTTSEIQALVLTSTTPLDGTAPAGSFMAPKMMSNYMERVRESVNIGTHSNADALVFDASIANQAKIKFYSFLERLQNKLIYSSFGVNPQNTAGNIGHMNGLLHFYKPHKTAENSYMNDAAGNATKMRAFNKVFTGGTFSRKEFETYLANVVSYGGFEKIIFASPSMATELFYNLMPANAQTAQGTFVIPGTTKRWEAINITLGTGIIHVIPLFGTRGQKMNIWDNTDDDSLFTTTDKWGIVYDSANTELLYHDVPEDGGIQSPSLRDVNLPMDDSRKMKNWNTELSLYLKRPEVGGVFGIKPASQG